MSGTSSVLWTLLATCTLVQLASGDLASNAGSVTDGLNRCAPPARERLAPLALRGTLLVTAADGPLWSFFGCSWVGAVRQAGIRYWLVAPTDAAAAAAVEREGYAAGGRCILGGAAAQEASQAAGGGGGGGGAVNSGNMSGSTEGYVWQSNAWKRATWAKVGVVAVLVRLGFHVLYSDIDVSWAADPLGGGGAGAAGRGPGGRVVAVQQRLPQPQPQPQPQPHVGVGAGAAAVRGPTLLSFVLLLDQLATMSGGTSDSGSSSSGSGAGAGAGAGDWRQLLPAALFSTDMLTTTNPPPPPEEEEEAWGVGAADAAGPQGAAGAGAGAGLDRAGAAGAVADPGVELAGSPHQGLNTGVYFVRAGPAGSELMRSWLAVKQAGFSGHDQQALNLLLRGDVVAAWGGHPLPTGYVRNNASATAAASTAAAAGGALGPGRLLGVPRQVSRRQAEEATAEVAAAVAAAVAGQTAKAGQGHGGRGVPGSASGWASGWAGPGLLDQGLDPAAARAHTLRLMSALYEAAGVPGVPGAAAGPVGPEGPGGGWGVVLGCLPVSSWSHTYAFATTRLHQVRRHPLYEVHWVWGGKTLESKRANMRDVLAYWDTPQYYYHHPYPHHSPRQQQQQQQGEEEEAGRLQGTAAAAAAAAPASGRGLLTFELEYPELPPGYNSWPEARTEDMVATHLHSLNSQLQQTYWAFVLALALNRTLVLPRFRCACARNWYKTTACRITAERVTTFPFDCPLSHVLRAKLLAEGQLLRLQEPGAGAGPGESEGAGGGVGGGWRVLEVRERSFLDNPRTAYHLRHSRRTVLRLAGGGQRGDSGGGGGGQHYTSRPTAALLPVGSAAQQAAVGLGLAVALAAPLSYLGLQRALLPRLAALQDAGEGEGGEGPGAAAAASSGPVAPPRPPPGGWVLHVPRPASLVTGWAEAGEAGAAEAEAAGAVFDSGLRRVAATWCCRASGSGLPRREQLQPLPPARRRGAQQGAQLAGHGGTGEGRGGADGGVAGVG